jgi:hypothetical protein
MKHIAIAALAAAIAVTASAQSPQDYERAIEKAREDHAKMVAQCKKEPKAQVPGCIARVDAYLVEALTGIEAKRKEQK